MTITSVWHRESVATIGLSFGLGSPVVGRPSPLFVRPQLGTMPQEKSGMQRTWKKTSAHQRSVPVCASRKDRDSVGLAEKD